MDITEIWVKMTYMEGVKEKDGVSNIYPYYISMGVLICI